MRLLAVTTHAIQYFAPLYRELAKHPDVDLTVAFSTDLGLREGFDVQFGQRIKWDLPLGDGYHYVVMPEHPGVRSVPGPLKRRNWSVRKLVADSDVVLLSSFLSITDQVATWSALVRGKPILYRAESTLLTPRSRWRDAARSAVLPWFFRRVATALFIGQQNREYLRRFGVPEHRLIFSPYAVDNERFFEAAKALAPRRAALRSAFGLEPDSPVVLFSGKFIPKKQPLLLLEAFRRLQAVLPCQLLLVGDGELRPTLERLVREGPIPGVHFTGFINQSKIAEAYTAADLLVLPSAFDETWGLVMNEAMCFGLPVVASDRVGGAYDLVEDGVTGFRFLHDDVGDLQRVLARLLRSELDRGRMGRAARDRVARYSVTAAADGILTAARLAIG